MQNNLKIIGSLIITGGLFFSCTTEKNSEIIAKAGNSYLKKSDIETWVGEGLSPEDSTKLVDLRIGQWAETELLAQEALKVLPKEKKKSIDEQVLNYRSELLNDFLLQNNGDSLTLISDRDITNYYKKYKENFKLNKEIVKLNYITFRKDSIDNETISKVDQLFRRNDKESQEKLQMEGLNKSVESNLSDTTWTYFSDYYLKLPFPKISNKGEFLKRTKFLRLHDSINVYLVKISAYKLKKDLEPIQLSKDKIEKMLKVQKNKNYIDKLKENLLNKAKKNKEFEIYEKD